MFNQCSYSYPASPMSWHDMLSPFASPPDACPAPASLPLQSRASPTYDYMNQRTFDYSTMYEGAPSTSTSNWSEYVHNTNYSDFALDPYPSPAPSVDFSSSYSPPTPILSLPTDGASDSQFLADSTASEEEVYSYRLPAVDRYLSLSEVAQLDADVDNHGRWSSLETWPHSNGLTPREYIPFEPYVCETEPSPFMPALRIPLRKRGSTTELSSAASSECRKSRKRMRFVDGLSGAPLSTTTTPFISKLVHLLSRPEYHELIRWNDTGTHVLFPHACPGLLEVFAVMYRHSKASSFIRQLNIYGFNRVAVAPGDLKGWSSELGLGDVSAFAHPYFFCDKAGVRCDTAVLKPRPSKTKGAASESNAQSVSSGRTSFVPLRKNHKTGRTMRNKD